MKLEKTIIIPVLLLSFCKLNNDSGEIHLIPDKYSGQIVIIFDCRDGEDKAYDEKHRRIYKIPESGILKTKFKPLNKFISFDNLRYYYVNDTIEYTEIPSRNPFNEIEDFRVQVFAGESGSCESDDGTISYNFMRYYVGKYSEYDSVMKAFSEINPCNNIN